MRTLDRDALQGLARAYLDRQPWFQSIAGGAALREIKLEVHEVLREEAPCLARLVLSCRGRRYSLFVGWRTAPEVARCVRGKESAIFGSTSAGDLTVLVYDALADDELAVDLLGRASGGRASGKRVRQLSSLVSHASLVFDERVLMKSYRVLEEGTRPEIELLWGLDRVGFNAMLAPIGFWHTDGVDLALVREFLPTALEGRLLALTSLRDLLARITGYDSRARALQQGDDFEPAALAAAAGGDLGSEMRRLGATVASMHLALAAAFDTRPLSADELVASLGPFDERPHDPNGRLVGALEGLGAAAGCEIRLHGDLHLRRVMRVETGWVISGFGDDPLYVDPQAFTSMPAQRGSPCEDLADMWMAIHRVAREALAQRSNAETDPAERLADAWTWRNQQALLRGYVTVPGIERLVPLQVLEPLVSALAAERAADYEATLSAA